MKVTLPRVLREKINQIKVQIDPIKILPLHHAEIWWIKDQRYVSEIHVKREERPAKKLTFWGIQDCMFHSFLLYYQHLTAVTNP